MLHERMMANLRLVDAADMLVLVRLVVPLLPCAASAAAGAGARAPQTSRPEGWETVEPKPWNISEAAHLVLTLIRQPFVLSSEKMKLQPSHELELLAELMCTRNTMVDAVGGIGPDEFAQFEWASMAKPFETIVQRMLELQVGTV
jgi:hypothetical protein